MQINAQTKTNQLKDLTYGQILRKKKDIISISGYESESDVYSIISEDLFIEDLSESHSESEEDIDSEDQNLQ
ncbi:hypothetical protein SLA2020_048950 [Shorea laevis]